MFQSLSTLHCSFATKWNWSFFATNVELHVVEQKTCFTVEHMPIRYQVITYHGTFHAVMTFVLPFLCLCFFNISIVKALRKSSAVNREQSRVRHDRPNDDVRMTKSESRCTKVMLALVVVFAICQLPEVVLLIVDRVESSIGGRIFLAVYYYCLAISLATLSVNSACNFFLYFLVGKRFRQILLGSLQHCRYHRD